MEKLITTFPPLDFFSLMARLIVGPTVKQKFNRAKLVKFAKQAQKASGVWILPGIKSSFLINYERQSLKLSYVFKKKKKLRSWYILKNTMEIVVCFHKNCLNNDICLR